MPVDGGSDDDDRDQGAETKRRRVTEEEPSSPSAIQLIFLAHPTSLLLPPLTFPITLAAIGAAVTASAESSVPFAHGQARSCLRETT